MLRFQPPWLVSLTSRQDSWAGLVPPSTLRVPDEPPARPPGRYRFEFSVRLPEHRCFCGFTFLFDFTSSSTVCLSIAAFMASLPVFDRLPEHRCFYGLTSSSSVCPSITAFMALLPLRPSARASLLLWLHFQSSTVCPSIAAFMASLPLRQSARASLLLWLHLPLRPSARAVVADFRRFCGFSFPIWGPAPDHGITFWGLHASFDCCLGAAVSRPRRDVVAISNRHEPSRSLSRTFAISLTNLRDLSLEPPQSRIDTIRSRSHHSRCWTLFLFSVFFSLRGVAGVWTGPSLVATDKSGGDGAGRRQGNAPGVVRSRASWRQLTRVEATVRDGARALHPASFVRRHLGGTRR